jgi:hypothetical protein
VFYFETLLNQGLAGIDKTAMLTSVTGIAYGILLIGFLVGLYQAAVRGGDLQALGVTAIKYVAIAIIVANWPTVFREVNSSFSQVAHAIYSSSTAGDVFLSWLDQLKQQFESDGTTSFLGLVSNTNSALITVLLVFVAYIIYVLAIVVFGFFYTLYGCVLYVLGPLVLALLPIPGVGQLAKSFATNVCIWSGWGILYAIFASLITAIQANRINDLSTFIGFFRGGLDSTVLGLISIFYALALFLIPFIAKKIVSGDVGAAAYAMVRSAFVAAGAAVSAGAGFAAGASTATAVSGGAAGLSPGTATSAATNSSSSMPPPEPSLAGTIRSGMSSAFHAESPHPQSGAGMSNGKSGDGKGEGKRDGSAGSSQSRSSSQGGVGTFRPIGLAQTLAYQAGRAMGTAAREAARAAKQSGDNANGNGKES